MVQDTTDNKSTLVPVLAWCHWSPSHYLNQCWPSFMMPYGIIWSQCLKDDWKSFYLSITYILYFHMTQNTMWYPQMACHSRKHTCVFNICFLTSESHDDQVTARARHVSDPYLYLFLSTYWPIFLTYLASISHGCVILNWSDTTHTSYFPVPKVTCHKI